MNVVAEQIGHDLSYIESFAGEGELRIYLSKEIGELDKLGAEVTQDARILRIRFKKMPSLSGIPSDSILGWQLLAEENNIWWLVIGGIVGLVILGKRKRRAYSMAH